MISIVILTLLGTRNYKIFLMQNDSKKISMVFFTLLGTRNYKIFQC
jgi:hypothetical protein